MAIKYFVSYADKFTDAEWADDFGGYTERFIKIKETLSLACNAVGILSDEYILGIYRYGILPEQDKQLGLQNIGISQLPQLFFTRPSEVVNSVDELISSGKVIYLAKLVKGQITRANMEIMLKTVRALEYRKDPTTGAPSFYDPTFKIFPGSLIGFNPTSAPGGAIIGLGLNLRLTLNRGGQIVDNIISTLKRLLPWIVGGIVVYEYNKHGQKGKK